MSNDGDEPHPTMTYPTQTQWERWERRADERGMPMSEFVECMVEAGLKKFDATVTPDEDVAGLRRQRNDLKAELDDARDRISRLEDELHAGERGAIRDFVRQNPGSTYDDIVRHIIDTVPGRVTAKLDSLEGTAVQVETDEDGVDLYYPVRDGGDR